MSAAPKKKVQHYLVSNRTGRVVDLPLDRSLFIGRSEGSSFRINDFRVSRQHAELYWDGGAFILHDLQSSNGTWVNSERIDSVELTDSDQIEIGAEGFTYRATGSTEKLAILRQKIRRQNARMGTEICPEMQINVRGGELQGALDSVPLAEVVQMLNQTKRTGLLVIRAGGGKALLYFYKGEITQAEQFEEGGDVICGDDAVIHALLYLKEGTFAFKPECQAISDNVLNKTTFLLFEAARQADESNQ